MNKKSQQIFETAIRMFLRYGYNNTSMDDVAKEAGVSKQTIYNNFVSKLNILKLIVNNESKKYFKDIENVEITSENFELLLEKFCRNFLSLVADPKLAAIHRIVISEIQNNPEISKTFFLTGPEKTYAVLEEFYRQAQEKGLIKIKSPKKMADLTISGLKGKYYLELLFGVREEVSSKELEEHLDTTLKFLRANF